MPSITPRRKVQSHLFIAFVSVNRACVPAVWRSAVSLLIAEREREKKKREKEREREREREADKAQDDLSL